MDGRMNEDNPIGSPIYRPLDVTRREIRLLELYAGTGDAAVEGRLVLTSIPLPIPIADRFLDTEEELRRKRANVRELELTKLRQISQLIQGLETQRTVLQRECDSLKSQVERVNEQSLAVQQKELDSRLKELKTKIERHQRSRHELVQIVKQGRPITVKPKEPSISDMNASYPTERTSRASGRHDRSQAFDMIQTESYYEHTSNLQYEAVSYCWNTGQPEIKMCLDGVAFMAPPSAIDVLRNLRFVDRTRTLWIDALCINQKDDKEKGQQVAMMGDIYRNSTATLIWLGPSDDNSETRNAIDLCSAVAQQILKDLEFSELPDLETIASDCQSISIPKGCSPVLLDVIYSRRWFTRLWVWQEAALSPVSVCHIGSFTMPWQNIMLTAFWWIEAADQYKSLPDDILPSDETELNMHFPSTILMIGMKSDREKIFTDAHLSQLVRQSRHCSATEGRDKIFGLLGMIRWSKSGRQLPLGITPNYEESKRNCMRNATRVMLEEDRSLDCLSDDLLDVARGSGSEYDTWPSWTPTWCETSDIPGPLWLDPTYNTHNGRALSIDTLAQCADPDILILHGYQVDVVDTTILITDEHFADIENLPTNFQSLHKSTKKLAALPRKELLLTLLADRYQYEKINEDSPIVQTCIDCFAENIEVSSYSRAEQSHAATDDSVMKEQFRAELESVRADLRMTSVGRRLFITTGGRIGIGPSAMNDQDIAVVLFGGKWPFILRKGKGYYVLIGHSFIHGIMDGEFVMQMEARGVSAERFDIH